MTKKKRDESTTGGPNGSFDRKRRSALETLARGAAGALVGGALADAAARDRPRSKQRELAGLLEPLREATRKGVHAWIEGARIEGGVINGAQLDLAPGCLGGPSFERTLRVDLQAAGLSKDAATAFAGVAWEAWRGWSATYSGRFAKAFPALAAVAAREAPPTEIEPQPLRTGGASGAQAMSAAALRDALRQRLDPAWLERPGAETLVDGYTDWYAERFTEWFDGATLTGLVGVGFGTYAPPYVPIGPIENGRAEGRGVLGGPDF